MTPTDFAAIKQKIETSSLLSAREREEWLYLLPRMSEDQVKELDRILSIHLPPKEQSLPKPPPAKLPEKKIELPHILPPKPEKAEHEERGMPPRPSGKPLSQIFSARNKEAVSEVSGAVPSAKLLDEFKDLRSISLSDLRAASSAQAYFTNLRTKIYYLLEQNVGRGVEIAQAFEQSPLYREYLESGLKKMSGEEGASLSSDELEALTDFRRSLRKLLNI